MTFKTILAGTVATLMVFPAAAETTLRIQTSQNSGEFVATRFKDIWIPKLALLWQIFADTIIPRFTGGVLSDS